MLDLQRLLPICTASSGTVLTLFWHGFRHYSGTVLATVSGTASGTVLALVPALSRALVVALFLAWFWHCSCTSSGTALAWFWHWSCTSSGTVLALFLALVLPLY